MISIPFDRIIAPSTLLLLLKRPGTLLIPDDEKELLAAREKKRIALASGERSLLDLFILTTFLLNKRNNNGPGHYDIQINGIQQFFSFLQGLEPDQIVKASWGAVPVAGTSHGGQAAATITWFIIGCLAPQPEGSLNNPWPDWVLGRTDEKARIAINLAFLAAQRLTGKSNRLYCYPLASIDGNDPLLGGRSLGLPVALAAVSLLRGTVPKQTFLATGDVIDQDGTIGPVNINSLRAKGMAAREAQMPLFLYPHGNMPAPDISWVFAVPVNTLRQAFLWADCYLEGNFSGVQRLNTALQSKRDLVNGIDNLPAELLEWLKETGTSEDLINSVIEDKILSEQLADKLELCLKHAEGNFQIASRIAELIGDKEQILKMGATNPAAALSWCSSNLVLANHCGANESGKFWLELGMQWAEQAWRSDKGRQIYSKFFNRRFGITERHNIYHFERELPPDFVALMRSREDRHRVDCALTECSDYILGSMYGTIAQNLAFCGPENISETINYLKKARKVLGNEYTKDIRQEYSYQFFALLDAGPGYAEDAARCLLKSMGLDSIEDIQFDRLQKFEHYGLLRAIIEIPEQLPRSCLDALKVLAIAKFASINTLVPADAASSTIHPWQLWCYNLGKLARQIGDNNMAANAWRKSCELCERCGETIQIMALLPLAALFQDKVFECEVLEKTSRILQLIRDSQTLHQEHFEKLLIVRAPEKVLRLVSEHPGKYFPFNYR